MNTKSRRRRKRVLFHHWICNRDDRISVPRLFSWVFEQSSDDVWLNRLLSLEQIWNLWRKMQVNLISLWFFCWFVFFGFFCFFWYLEIEIRFQRYSWLETIKLLLMFACLHSSTVVPNFLCSCSASSCLICSSLQLSVISTVTLKGLLGLQSFGFYNIFIFYETSNYFVEQSHFKKTFLWMPQ